MTRGGRPRKLHHPQLREPAILFRFQPRLEALAARDLPSVVIDQPALDDAVEVDGQVTMTVYLVEDQTAPNDVAPPTEQPPAGPRNPVTITIPKEVLDQIQANNVKVNELEKEIAGLKHDLNNTTVAINTQKATLARLANQRNDYLKQIREKLLRNPNFGQTEDYTVFKAKIDAVDEAIVQEKAELERLENVKKALEAQIVDKEQHIKGLKASNNDLITPYLPK